MEDVEQRQGLKATKNHSNHKNFTQYHEEELDYNEKFIQLGIITANPIERIRFILRQQVIFQYGRTCTNTCYGVCPW
jgi:hypothetical protein